MSAYERTPLTHGRARMDASCAHTLPKTRQRMSARTPPYPPVCVPPYGRPRTRMGARVRALIRLGTSRGQAARRGRGNSSQSRQSLLRLSGRPAGATGATLGDPGASAGTPVPPGGPATPWGQTLRPGGRPGGGGSAPNARHGGLTDAER